MGVPRQIDGLKSLCLIPGASDFTLHGSGPWKRLSRYPGLALTVVGAGAAFLALRYTGNSCRAACLCTPFVWNWPNPLVKELGVPGLKNTGNICFLNVILQALASSEEFISFLTLDCQLASRNNDSLDLAAPLLELLTELSGPTSERKVANTDVFMRSLLSASSGFDFSKQQDAAELLNRLAELLKTERNAFFQKLQPDVDSFADVPLIASDANPSARGSRVASDDSKRQRLLCPLEGRTQSLMSCQRCDHKFLSIVEGFTCIALALPSKRGSGSITEGCDLDGCLDLYTSVEVVSDFNCIRCSHRASAQLHQEQEIEYLKHRIRACNLDDDCHCEVLTVQAGGAWMRVNTQVQRRLMISCAPKVLCLQIPRARSSSNDGHAQPRKLKGHVKFPTLLDLSRYMITRVHADTQDTPARLRMQGDGNAGDHSTLVPVGQQSATGGTSSEGLSPRTMYQLISVVEHQGHVTESGHFTAYRRVRIPKPNCCFDRLLNQPRNSAKVSASGPVTPTVQWFKVSDSDVSRVSEEVVLQTEASLLFYQQIAD